MAVFGKSDDEENKRIITDLINRVNENVRRLTIASHQASSLRFTVLLVPLRQGEQAPDPMPVPRPLDEWDEDGPAT